MVALALMNSVALASARRTGARTDSNGLTGSGTIADFAEGYFVTAIRRTTRIRSFPPVPSTAVRSHRGVYIVKGEQTRTEFSVVRMQGFVCRAVPRVCFVCMREEAWAIPARWPSLYAPLNSLDARFLPRIRLIECSSPMNVLCLGHLPPTPQDAYAWSASKRTPRPRRPSRMATSRPRPPVPPVPPVPTLHIQISVQANTSPRMYEGAVDASAVTTTNTRLQETRVGRVPAIHLALRSGEACGAGDFSRLRDDGSRPQLFFTFSFLVSHPSPTAHSM